nr:amidase [Gammaproteobacteria bacterium]
MSQCEISLLSANELVRRYRDGSLSPVEVTAAVLDRIAQCEPDLNALITVCDNRARAQSEAAQAALLRGEWWGPLHGVPFTVKDLLNTREVLTTFGSHAFADNIPQDSCVAVQRLEQAGAILVGKTTTPEFGHKPLTEAPLFGRTRNPWDHSRTPGGSSGGAGAGVAAGYGPLAVGTDGGGSIRIPAAACGVVGMKQTLGVVPHDQTPDAFGLLAYIGPMTRTVTDAAMMLEVMSGPHASDPHTLGRQPERYARVLAQRPPELDGVRIAYCATLGNEHVSTDVMEALNEAVELFRSAGATVVSLDTHDFPDTLPVWGPLTFSIWASRFAAHEKQLGDRMSETLRTWMQQGRDATAVDVQDAMAFRTSLYRRVEKWFTHVDYVLTPTLSRTALS